MTDEIKVQVRFPDDIWLATKQFAREDGLSFNAEILWILKRYIDARLGDSKMLDDLKYPWPNVEFREWQTVLTKKFRADWYKGKRRWLVEVAPGGGKTLWALLLARWLLDEKLIKRVVIVCPKLHIRDQWINHNKNEDGTEKFPPILELTCETNKNGAIENPADFHGVVLTYHQLASGEGAKLQNDACLTPGTLVIADEIHHIGIERDHGKAYAKAFMKATAQIGLTGTPWTSEGAGPIPYVEYEEKGDNKGKVINDGYHYTRPEAIDGDVLRQTQFFAFDAEIKLQNLEMCVPTVISQKLSDTEDESEMLDLCIRPYSAWMKSILKEADRSLLGIINGTDGDEAVPDAKGLVTAKTQQYAKAIQEQLGKIIGQPVALIISDRKDAKEQLDKFRRGDLGRWAVSVAMVSEGVDIPSLFVGVYVTNICTDKFWRQFAGRFERKRHKDERNPMIFFPATPTFMNFAATMNKEVPTSLEGWPLPDYSPSPKPGPGREEESTVDYHTGTATLHRVIEDDKVYRPSEHMQGIAICEKQGIPTRYALKVFTAWQEYTRQESQSHNTSSSQTPSASKSNGSHPRVETLNNHQLKRALKTDLDKLVKSVAYMRASAKGDLSIANQEIQTINVVIIRRWAKRDKMSIDQLKEARAYVDSLREVEIQKQQQFGV